MYNFEWDTKTRGYRLTTQTSKFVASELRPVFAEELDYLGGKEIFEYSSSEQLPLLWAKQQVYYYNGEECAKVQTSNEGTIKIEPVQEGTTKIKLQPVDMDRMLQDNQKLLESLVSDTLKRIKEMYMTYQNKCDVTYIGFSGGKDSLVLLDLCDQVLPQSIPVIFSDTDMELPDTLKTWENIQKQYQPRPFIKVKSPIPAITNWEQFGPPSQQIRWCCSVHKNVPAIVYLRHMAHNPRAKTLAFLGVRSEESLRRSTYDDIGDGLKNPSQVNAMPILSWSTQELFLYIFSKKLPINNAYRLGLPRVGCLLCPMSTTRQSALIRLHYKKQLEPFIKTIKHSLAREFENEKDLENFIYTGGWHTRQSGVSLNEIILAPREVKTQNELTYNFQPCSINNLIEWFKTLGNCVLDTQSGNYILSLREGDIRLSFDTENDKNTTKKLVCNFDSVTLQKVTPKLIKNVIHKAISCIGCNACTSECPTGALSVSEHITVDSSKCIHCLRCHSTQEGCLRYYSKRYAGGLTMNISGINKYLTFGLKQDWLSILATEGDNFRSTGALGNRMIPSAITWFKEAKLVSDGSLHTTALMTYAQNNGYGNLILWHCIWIALANNSPLIKWYVCNSSFDTSESAEDLREILSKNVSSDSVRKGALQSLFQTLKNSPLGNSSNALVEMETKGQRVISLKRVPRSVDRMVILYSLYVMAQVANRTSFTVSEMMTSDFESPFISPLVAFGLSVDEFKGLCLGLASVYPTFISCSFSLGLEEIKIFPNEKSLDDVVQLML